MKNFITGLTLAILFFSHINASEASELTPKQTLIELGGSLTSNVEGKGPLPLSAKAESGYKITLTHAINDHLAIQYKRSEFQSEEKTMLAITTTADAVLDDVNLIYKLNKNFDAVLGYEHNKITYGKAVSPAVKSNLHFGLIAHTDLSDKALLYASYIQGKDTSLAEVGVKYDLTKNSLVTLSYVDRHINNMDVSIDAYRLHTKVDYQLSGLSLMYGLKF